MVLAAPAAASAQDDWRTAAPENLLVIDTAKGRILVELDPRVAPQSVNRIRTLADQRFYDGLKFHRRRCGWLQRLRPPFLGLVTLPAWLSRSGEAQGTYRERLMADAAKARFILEMTLKRLPRLLDQTQPRPKRASTWSDYMATHSYNDEAFKVKESFVREALAEARPDWVLDVGANTGHFSALAASAGASVVALDSDVQCVDGIWRRAREQNLDILPLVVDFARSSPALGWRNREQPSFLERAGEAFDAVLMLAVLHHLLVALLQAQDADIVALQEVTPEFCGRAAGDAVDPRALSSVVRARRRGARALRSALLRAGRWRSSCTRSRPASGCWSGARRSRVGR